MRSLVTRIVVVCARLEAVLHPPRTNEALETGAAPPASGPGCSLLTGAACLQQELPNDPKEGGVENILALGPFLAVYTER